MPDVVDSISRKQMPEPAMSERIRRCLNAAFSWEKLDLHARYRSVDRVLAEVGSALGADRAYLFDIDNDGLTVSNSNEWCGVHVMAQRASLQRVPLVDFRWFMSQLRDTGIIEIRRIDIDIPAVESYTKSFLKMQGIKSLLVAALERDRQVTGFVGFDCVKAERLWSANDLLAIRLLAVMLSAR